MKNLGVLISFLMLISWPVSAHESSEHDGLMIETAWAPHTGRRTASAAVYLTIKNSSNTADALIDIKTDRAASAMLHVSKEVGTIMQMEHVARLPLPAHTSVSLTPGGHHIMLMRLTKPLKRGEIFPLNLTFEQQGDVTILVEITGIGGPEHN